MTERCELWGAEIVGNEEVAMPGYSCQDCTRCSRSAFGSLMRGVAAVATLGVSEAAVAASGFFKQTCPGCDHPMSEHTAARHLYEQSQPQYHAQPTPPAYALPNYCPHYRFLRTPKGNGFCQDCGDKWDAHGHRWDRFDRLYM